MHRCETSGPVFIQHPDYQNSLLRPYFNFFIYLQIADVDFYINGTEFKFYVKPYFLR